MRAAFIRARTRCRALKKAAMGDRRVGWVKFFSPQRGYGFLTDVQSGQDAFVHFSGIQRRDPGWRGLYRGEYVSYIQQTVGDKVSALDVQGVACGPLLCEIDSIETAEFA